MTEMQTSECSSDCSTDDNIIRLTDLKYDDKPFFLDFEIFLGSLEAIYRTLEITPCGPSAALDFYQLYCQHIRGDSHITRLLQSLCEISHRYSSIREDIIKAMERASRTGQKAKANFIQFCLNQDIEFVLNDPFVLPELDFRMLFYKAWQSGDGIGVLTPKRKREIYKLYCLHMLKNRHFFHGIFGVSLIIPHGPYNLGYLEQALVMFKSVPDASFLTGPDACVLAWYIKEDFGVDHEFFKKLPRVLRLVISNDEVQITCPKVSRVRPSGSTHEYLQLVSTSPSVCRDPIRVQLRFPSELVTVKEQDQSDVFTWVFLSTQDPGTFMIRNERWNDYLTVEEPEESGLCLVSTTLNSKDPRARFNLCIEGQFLRIISTILAAPIIVDAKSEQAYVPTSKDRHIDAAIFLLKTVR